MNVKLKLKRILPIYINFNREMINVYIYVCILKVLDRMQKFLKNCT